MNRVEVTRPFFSYETHGIYAICMMQVCAASDATDEEILEVCNRENPAGTELGWTTVIRTDDQHEFAAGAVKCGDYKGRQHLLVMC